MSVAPDLGFISHLHTQMINLYNRLLGLKQVSTHPGSKVGFMLTHSNTPLAAVMHGMTTWWKYQGMRWLWGHLHDVPPVSNTQRSSNVTGARSEPPNRINLVPIETEARPPRGLGAMLADTYKCHDAMMHDHVQTKSATCKNSTDLWEKPGTCCHIPSFRLLSSQPV